MAEQLDISLVERQRCAIEFWNPTTHPSSGDDAMRRAAVFKWWKRFRDGETKVPLSTWRLRQNVCRTFSTSGWSVVRSASLAKGGTSKKRPSPHLHKVPTRSNNVSLRTFQTALVLPNVRGECDYEWHIEKSVIARGSAQNILSKSMKIKILGTKVLPVGLYGCESWSRSLRGDNL
jgi:hypothetical protein